MCLNQQDISFWLMFYSQLGMHTLKLTMLHCDIENHRVWKRNCFYLSINFFSNSFSIYYYSATQSIYFAGKSVSLWLQVLISDILVSLVKFSAQ